MMKKTKWMLAMAAAMLASTAALAQDVPTLRIMTLFNPDATWTNDGVDAVEAALNPVLEEKIGAHIDLIPIPWGDYNQRMSLVMSSREPFDIAMTSSWINNFYRNVSQENLLALDEYLDDVPQLQADIPPELLKVGTVNGKLYGIPVQQMFPKTFGFNTRADLVEKYDIDLASITSYEQLTPIFEEVVAGEGEGFYAFGGKVAAAAELFGYDPVATSGTYTLLAVKMDDPERKIVNFYATPEYRAQVKLRRQWHEMGLTDPNPMNRDQFLSAVTAGTVGFNMDSAQDRPTHRIFQGLPFQPKRIAPIALTTAAMNASMWSVSADSEHPVEALRLIHLLNTDAEVVNGLALGVEGVNWQWNADKTLVELLDKASYWPNIKWVWGNSFLIYPQKASDIADNEESLRMNAEATPSVMLGFAFDITPVENEMAALGSIIPNLEALDNGRVEDVDSFLDQQLAEMEVAGLPRVIEELQRQIDAWLATSN